MRRKNHCQEVRSPPRKLETSDVTLAVRAASTELRVGKQKSKWQKGDRNSALKLYERAIALFEKIEDRGAAYKSALIGLSLSSSGYKTNFVSRKNWTRN